MENLELIVLDAAAIAVLVFGLYFPRHRRRDMVLAFLVVNVGVLAVAEALLASTISAGLGLGLFGVLSIIRLRSSELSQHEVAYYFAALALGLLGGLTTTTGWVSPALMGLVIAAVWVGDHPRLFADHRLQVVTLDGAYTDERLAAAHLEDVLDADISGVTISKVDLVKNTTTVQVRFRLRNESAELRPIGQGGVS